MTDWLLVVLGVAVAAICPIHIWWAHRRGSRAACCPPRTVEQPGSELEDVRARQLALSAQLRAFER
jgi:hypothetical protein